MPLKEELQQQGDWLFRWRSYVPLALVPVLLAAIVTEEPPVRSPADRWWMLFCLGVSLVGLGIRVLTVGFVPRGTSGRNTRRQMARQLNSTGMYSVVRHPLYLGNMVIWLGIAMTA